jgi:thioredoxin-related protein
MKPGLSTRMQVAVALLAMLAGAGYAAREETVEMITASDLREEARIARESDLVLVLEFSSEYCGYCRKLEAMFLLPMQRNAEYDDKILIRSVSLDSYETVTDFEGNFMSTREFAARYRVSVTPTLLFLNSDGVEVSEKLVGIWSEDFFGVFIDDRIEEARANI